LENWNKLLEEANRRIRRKDQKSVFGRGHMTLGKEGREVGERWGVIGSKDVFVLGGE